MGAIPTKAELLSAPKGALSILARRGDSEVLITHGRSRAADIEAGERMAVVKWYDTVETAAAISHFCSETLKTSFPAVEDSWHPYAVEHLPTLINLATSHLNVTVFPRGPEPRERQAWTRERWAHLGLRVGQCWTAKKIAGDPLIRTTENNVYQRVSEVGLSLALRPHGQASLRLPADVLAFFDREAERENLTRDAVMARRLIEMARPAKRG